MSKPTHEQVVAQVKAGSVSDAQTFGKDLHAVGVTLSTIQQEISSSFSGLREAWQGPAADRFISALTTMNSYLDTLLTQTLLGSTNTYTEIVAAAADALSHSQKEVNLPPPVAGGEQAILQRKATLTAEANDAMSMRIVNGFKLADQQLAEEHSDYQTCLNTQDALKEKYKTLEARLEAPPEAPGGGSGSGGAGFSDPNAMSGFVAPTGGSHYQGHLINIGTVVPTPTIDEPNVDDWQDNFTLDPTGDPSQVDVGSVGDGTDVSGGGVSGGISADGGGGGFGGLSGGELAGLGGLAGAGVIGAGAWAKFRGGAGGMSMAGVDAAALREREAAAAAARAREAQLARAAGSAGAGQSAIPRRGVIGGKHGEGEDGERETWLTEDREIFTAGKSVSPVVGQTPDASRDAEPE